MKIWKVTANDNQVRFWWFETKKKAEDFAKQYRDENSDDNPTTDVRSVEFDATRKGLAEAMNHVITLTCFNEG